MFVDLSVCHTSDPCENGLTDQDTVWLEDSGGPEEPLLDGSPDPPWEGHFWEGSGRPL